MEDKDKPTNPLRQFNLDKSPGVELYMEQEGIKPNSNPDDILDAYLLDLSTTIGQLDEEKQARLMDVVKQCLHNTYCIKPEQITDSYFAKQEATAREMFGQELYFSEEEKQAEREKIISVQTERLDEWVDYLASKQEGGGIADPYSLELRLFVLKGILGLGKLKILEDETTGEKTYSFTRRMKKGSTVAPFPELRRGALALLMSRLKAYYEPSPSGTGDEPDNDDSPVLDELIRNKANIGVLYAEAIKETSYEGDRNLEKTEGEWRIFKQGSDPKLLYESLKGRGSNLCIGDGLANAISYIKRGDMYVYYSIDQDGDYQVPRSAISVVNGKVMEVRGTYNSNEDLDPYITDVVKDKLDELPEGGKYFKRIGDAKTLSDIHTRFNNGETLTTQDLRFLYQIDTKVENFGYQQDERINEILDKRDKRTDLVNLFNCRSDQISFTKDEALSGDIIFHYGDLDLRSLTSAEGLSLPSSVGGYLDLESLTSAEGLSLPDSVGGYLDLRSLTSAEGLSLPSSVGGGLYLNSLTSAEGLSLPSSVGGYLNLRSLTSAEGLSLPSSVGGDLDLRSLTSAEGLSLPSSVGGDLYLPSLTSAEGLSLPSSVGGDLDLPSLTSAEGLSLPSSVGGDLNLRSLTSAEGLSLPSSVGGGLNLRSLTSAERNQLRLRYPKLRII